MERHAGNVHQKLVPNPYHILVNNLKQLLHARNFFKRKIFRKTIIQKLSKRLSLFFLLNQVLFSGQSYQKQIGPVTPDQLLFRLENKLMEISLLIMHYLTKFGIIYSGFWVVPKITSVNLCKPIYDIINYSNFICWVWVVCKRREENWKIGISQERKELFRWNKFHDFWRAVIWCKNKDLIKNSGRKL